jgi:hypothetical protein
MTVSTSSGPIGDAVTYQRQRASVDPIVAPSSYAAMGCRAAPPKGRWESQPNPSILWATKGLHVWVLATVPLA